MKHISALFVNPPVLAVKEPRYDTPDCPNISIAYVGAALRNYKGVCDVSMLDAKLERLTIGQAAERIRTAQADIVAFTGLTNDIEQVKLVLKKTRSDCPNSIFVLGGVHATVLPEETMLENPELDYLIVNEGEIAIQKLVDSHFLKEIPLTEVPNLYYRENGLVKKTKDGGWITNLDEVAFPAWDLFPKTFKYVSMMTARGCPFACRFCHPLGTVHRERSPDNVIAEVREILKYKPTILWFYDETFGINKQRMYEILRGLKEIPGLPGMAGTLRINTTTTELLDKMAEAGFIQVGFGIESASEKVLKDKLLDVNKAQALIQHARKVGIAIEGFFIFGHPDETRKEVWETIKLATRPFLFSAS